MKDIVFPPSGVDGSGIMLSEDVVIVHDGKEYPLSKDELITDPGMITLIHRKKIAFKSIDGSRSIELSPAEKAKQALKEKQEKAKADQEEKARLAELEKRQNEEAEKKKQDEAKAKVAAENK